MLRLRVVSVFCALALATVASFLPVAAQPRKTQAYEGAAKIGNLDRITVVYPASAAATDREVRTLEDNARLKASYLTERYGVLTETARDDAVTEAQRTGHLLVLGWDNLLTKDPWFGQVVQRDDKRILFLGVPASATDDLLWLHLNPYAKNKYLVFWSRVDPDRDRLLPFPFIGSDWAWYRDYFVRYQGNFNDQMDWPPVREPLAEHDEAFKPQPLVETSGHYAVHYLPGVTDDAGRADILARREAALAGAAELLGVAVPENFRIDLFVYRDDDKKFEHTGVSDPVHSLQARGELHMTAARARRAGPQEEIHLLAAKTWGQNHSAALSLGLAIYLQTDPRDQGAYAALLVEQDRVPRVADLFDDEKLRGLARAGYGFPAAALMVEWIVARGGNAALAETYGSLRMDAIETLARTFELADASAVEAAFGAWMVDRAAGATDDLAYRRARDKAAERARVGDYVGQIAALEEALAVRPAEWELAYQLGLVQIETGETDAARSRFEGLVAAAGEPAWVPVFSRVKLAELLSATGQTDGARRLYREVLAGPNEHDAHRYAREGLAALDDR